MSGNERSGKTLQARQERFLAAMLTANSLADAARTCDIPETTARRWLKQPDVREQYRELRRETVEHAIARVQGTTDAAVATLRRMLDPKMPPAIRARAAIALLDYAIKAVETTDILERLERLEAAAAQSAQATRGGRGA